LLPDEGCLPRREKTEELTDFVATEDVATVATVLVGWIICFCAEEPAFIER
jgi:hypothetical protein